MQNVAKLVVSQKQVRKSVRVTKAQRRQMMAAASVGTIAMVLTGLSLSHLAHGIELVTNSAAFESWSMAIGVDLGFVSIELAQLMCSGEKLRKQISKFTKPAIVGTLAGSAAMNAFAFAAQSSGWKQYAAAALGLSIPALIYAMTKVAAAMYIDCHSKVGGIK